MKLLPALLAAAFLTSCQKDSASAEPESSAEPKEVVGIVIETSKGTIRADLDPAVAPVTVKNFLGYVDKKFYDNTIFHRVISNFMIQGGGFEIENGIPKEKETGDGIFNESAQTEPNSRGTLAMARTSNPNSATSQFFINVKDNASLDYPNAGGSGYAVFGKVTEGMEIVDAIKDVETGEKMAISLQPSGRYVPGPFNDVPVEPVTILSIRRADPSE